MNYIKKVRIFKKYSSIENFLYRFTLLKIGKLHIRLHKIVDCDRTEFYHNHPFYYISFILKGGYIEKIIKNNLIYTNKYNIFSLIFGHKNKYHRIDKIFGETITLFIAYGNYSWDIISEKVNNENDGLYLREINGKILYSKKENNIFYIGHEDKEKAINEKRISIHQV